VKQTRLQFYPARLSDKPASWQDGCVNFQLSSSP